ncbi:hypothetical protein AB4298_08865 [Shewanella sp. 10N.261.52.F9]|uniref:hypothetical protein n=1 Tax=Shewanella TaxID=22 RepID=UPI00200FCA01|nr:hypothetical protein [Shewanella marinintestina]MCL1147866.1 hypothetical protein [Shewanella marinintestina]
MDETDFCSKEEQDLTEQRTTTDVYETINVNGQFIVERRQNGDSRSNAKLRAYDRRQSTYSHFAEVDIYI